MEIALFITFPHFSSFVLFSVSQDFSEVLRFQCFIQSHHIDQRHLRVFSILLVKFLILLQCSVGHFFAGHPSFSLHPLAYFTEHNGQSRLQQSPILTVKIVIRGIFFKPKFRISSL